MIYMFPEDGRVRGAGARLAALPALLLATSVNALAGTTELENGISLNYGMTVNYDVGIRTGKQSDVLINGPVNPVSGLPSTINMDDGNRNFKRHSLVNNRASLLAELEIKNSQFGFVTRASSFYDAAYRSANDNGSPATINKYGPVSEFTSQVAHYNGSRTRLLDAYAYGNWELGDQAALNLRLGKHVVLWGESMFFSGIAGAMGPVDATKFVLPGVELKDALLPVGQVSGQLQLGGGLSVAGYVQYEHQPVELAGPGSYMSYADMVGPGGQFIHMFANPLAAAPGALPTVRMARGPDIAARDSGQWGLSMRLRVTESTELGLYHLNYHDKNPGLVINAGDPVLVPGAPAAAGGSMAATFGIAPAGTPVAPVSYQIKYAENIRLTGMSFSTSMWDANIAGEVSYKKGVPVMVKVSGGPLANSLAATPGDVMQAQLSWIRGFNPTKYWDSLLFNGEIGVMRVMDVTPHTSFGTSYANLSNGKISAAYQFGLEPSYNGVFEGWDVSIPLNYAHLFRGIPAVAGGFGSLVGEGDRRLSIGAKFKYLGNLTISATYNAMLGKPDPTTRPLADRDYLAMNIKYSF